MATINGLNAIGSASMSAIGQKTPAQIAAEKQTKAVKDTVKALVAVSVDKKPAQLAVGEVAKVVDAKGKVEYYVGTADGKISKPLSTVSSAVSAVNTQVKKAEKIQEVALRTSQKISLAELKETLTQSSVPKADLSAAIKAEKAADAAELKEFKSLLAEPMLQYGARDPVTNTFTASSIKTPAPKSLLTYNDPVLTPKVQTNIKQAYDSVAEFQLLKGITQPFLRSGNTTSGINQYAIYQALNNGSIIATKDDDGVTTGYTVSPEVAKAKGDQSGFMNATGMSKASARALGLVLNNDTIIGGKANVTDDGKGNYVVNDATGADRYGTQKPLIDTGRVVDSGLKDANGNPIMNKVFAEVSTDNSKRNLVSVVSNYIQQPDNTFTYGGIDSTDYTHIEGFNPIKALVIAGMSAGLGYATPFLGGLTTVNAAGQTVATAAGIAAGGAVGGALNAALSGNNIIKGGLLGGATAFGANQLFELAQAAGGWDALTSKLGLDNFNVPTNTGVDGGAGGFTADPSGGLDFVSGAASTGGFTADEIARFNATGNIADTATNVANTATNLGTGAIDLSIPNTSITNTDINNYLKSQGIDVGGAGIRPDSIIPAGGAGIPMTGKTAISGIDAITGQMTDRNLAELIQSLPVPPDTTAMDLLNKSQWANVGSAAGDSLLDTAKNAWSNLPPWGQAAIAGGALKLGKDTITNLLTPNPKQTEYESFTLKNPTNSGNYGFGGGVGGVGGLPTTMPDWWNNLYARQGVGAGNYLGYDIMKGLNVPADVLSLLGSSAPTVSQAPVATA
jgi:hypothetical protein